ncbi:hypothetical protein [Streptomyces sp. NPDC001450]
MIRKCASALGGLLLASGCGGASSHDRSSAEQSPSADVSASASDTASATPDVSSSPLQLGVVDGLVTVRDCAPLTSGSPFNVRYFSFTLSGTPGTNAHAGASFALTQDALGPVYPAIVQPNGWILKTLSAPSYDVVDADGS